MSGRRVFLFAVVGVTLGWSGCTNPPAISSGDPKPVLTEYPLGLAYAGTEINATIFRIQSVASDAQHQFAAYYAPDGHIVLARRTLPQGSWDLRMLDIVGDLRDAHDDVVLGLSPDARLHLAYDHHNQPLHYRHTENLDPWWTFDPPGPMTGQREAHVTYPTFVNTTGGNLLFFYRDGQSGNGALCVDAYDATAHAWRVVQSPLLDGLTLSSPYWCRPEASADGVLHLAWCWRDSSNASTNHDICYIRSRDGGASWENSAGEKLALPVTPATANVVVRVIPKGSSLINQCALATDAQGHPHIAYYADGANGVPQYFHLWFDGQKWAAQEVSHRTLDFSVGGQGTLKLPMSRPEIAVSKSGAVFMITRDDEFGGGVRLYTARPPYAQWSALDLLPGPLGEWEPSYDLQRWRRDGVLSLFVLPVKQGDHENVTDYPPQIAKVVEMAGLE